MSIQFVEVNEDSFNPIPEVSGSFLRGDYEAFIYPLNLGDIFKVDENSILIETVFGDIQRFIPDNLSAFNVAYVEPGTTLYSIYGASTMVVVEKTEK